MARSPASAQVQVNFRMPADLKERIEAAAKANTRSTTAEIVAALEEKYPPTSAMLELLNWIVATGEQVQSISDPDEMISAWLTLRPAIIATAKAVIEHQKTFGGERGKEAVSGIEALLRSWGEVPDETKASPSPNDD